MVTLQLPARARSAVLASLVLRAAGRLGCRSPQAALALRDDRHAPRCPAAPVRAARRNPVTTDAPSPYADDAAPGVPTAPRPTDPPAALADPAAREAYVSAARWASIRVSEAVRDRAVVAEAYFLGFLDGMREAAEGLPAPAAGEDEEEEAEGLPVPGLDALEIRARLEGYADGRRWRERGKVGGLVRLGRYASGKSTRQFAPQELVHSAEKVRAWMKYKSNVPDPVRDELLRRLHLLRVAQPEEQFKAPHDEQVDGPRGDAGRAP